MTTQQPSAPATPEPEEAATASALPPPARDELSPIERLVAGNTPDPHARLRQFGYDLFTRVPTTFAPVTDVPVGPDYVLGPGDHLNVLLWGGVQEGYQVEVNRNGAVALPRLGVVQVWGLTLDQVQRLLQQRFSEFYADFHMAVTLGKLRTILVYVVGEVRQPGAYTISSLSTIINALFASGGPTKNGSLRRIQLVRKGRHIHTLDLYDLLLQGNKAQDQTLQSGDTILVPLIGPVAGVAGNVKRPAIYELDPDMTLQRLIDLAGGVTALGYLQRVQIERAVANERKVVVDVDLSAPRRKAAPTDLWKTRMADGDLARIFAILPSLDNAVQLEGHAVRPGRYELKPGMRLRDVITSYEVLFPEPYLEYGEIVRYIGADTRRTVVPFNLGALLAGDPNQNLSLHPRDIVRVFARADFVDPPQVRISGLVHRPGLYPLTEGMRVGDLVFRAAMC
jgi:protein involved in polysaccharide export with SLBB domain